jgi:hypothetical protein
LAASVPDEVQVASIPAVDVTLPEGEVTGVDDVLAGILGEVAADPNAVQVTTGPAPKVELVATREAWVRVNAPDGAVIFEGILGPGDTFEVPATEEPPVLRVGESGALFMAVNGVPYGPVGPAGQVTSNVALSPEAITGNYQVAEQSEGVLADYVAVASASGLSADMLPAETALPPAPDLTE